MCRAYEIHQKKISKIKDEMEHTRMRRGLRNAVHQSMGVVNQSQLYAGSASTGEGGSPSATNNLLLSDVTSYDHLKS